MRADNFKRVSHVSDILMGLPEVLETLPLAMQGQGHLGLKSQKDSPLKLLLNTTAKSRPLITGHRPRPSSSTAT